MIRPEMISAIDTGTGEALSVSLFLTENTGDNENPVLVPVDAAPGTTEFVLVRVENRTPAESLSLSPRDYRLQYNAPLGDSVDVAATPLRDAPDLHVFFDGQNFGGQGVVIPVGDFNGDGLEDFILSLAESTDSSGAPVGYARLIFGGDPILDPTSTATSPNSGTVLALPGSPFAESGPRVSVSRGGDANLDGFDDLLVSVNGVGTTNSVFVVLGSAAPSAQIEVNGALVQAGGAISIVEYSGPVEAVQTGSFLDDSEEGFVIVSGHQSYLFEARETADWFNEIPIPDENGTVTYDLLTSAQGFTQEDNDPTRDVWRHVAATTLGGNRYGMVLGGGGPDFYVNQSNAELPTRARTTSPVIDLTNAIDPMLRFDSLLQTEGVQGFDIARVLIRSDGVEEQLPGATNQGSGLLEEIPPGETINSSTPAQNIVFDLSDYVGQEIQIIFDFDSVSRATAPTRTATMNTGAGPFTTFE